MVVSRVLRMQPKRPRWSDPKNDRPGGAGLGRLSDEASRAVAVFAELELGLEGLTNRALGDQTALDLMARGDLEHGVEGRLPDDGLQRSRAGSARNRKLRDR